MKENPARKVPKRIIKAIQQANNIVIFTHSHPDGDALGSLFGLADILRSCDKNVFCYLEENISHLYDFLPNCYRAQTKIEKYHDFIAAAGADILCIALDCGDEDRLGKQKEDFLKVEPFIVIDHHQSHVDFGTDRWVDENRSSTGEMIYEIATALEVSISYECAYCLYVAISTDTGSFRYGNTGERTMQIAGDLLSKGVLPEQIGSHLYENYSKQRLKLLELTLSTIELCESDQIAFMYVNDEMIAQSGATIHDVEGFIDFPRAVKSVKVAVFIKENKKSMVSVSLRAKGRCNVAEVAKQFSGGGHRNAAGFKCHGKSINKVRQEVQEVLLELIQ